jgi:hypothetical protein
LLLSRNKISFFKQRLQIICQTTFASLLLLGNEKNQFIKCLFVFEGELPTKLVEEVSDYELYDWKKLTFENEEHKKIIETYLFNQENIGDEILESIFFR